MPNSPLNRQFWVAWFCGPLAFLIGQLSFLVTGGRGIHLAALF